jgi:predicted dehydrogenase
MTTPIRVAVVGSGKRAREHLTHLYDVRDRAYLETEADAEDPLEAAYVEHAATAPDWVHDVSHLDAEVTALVDPSAVQRERTAARCSRAGDDPSHFETTAEFLDDGPTCDAAIVTAPNASHPDVVCRLLETDVDILCEKPLAVTLAGHDRIADAAVDHSGVFYPGFNLRSSPFFQKIATMVRNGAIGSLGSITCHEVRRPLAAGYRYDSDVSGGALLEKNCHDFDLFNWFADGDPVRVSGAGTQHVLSENSDVDDQASVVVEYDDGTLATLELCLYAPWDQRHRRYELRGSEGLLRTPEEPLTVDRYGPDGTERVTVDAPGHHLGGDFYQLWRFLRCVVGDADPPGTIDEAKAAAAVAIAAQEAIDRRTTVEITDEYAIVPRSE